MKTRVAFLGAGSFSDGVLPYLNQEKYQFIGYFDDKPIENYRGFPVYGTLADSVTFLEEGKVDLVFVTIGDNKKRKEIFELISEQHYDALFNIISPQSAIMPTAQLSGKGIFVGFSAFIGSDSVIGDNCIINTSAIVEHHTIIKAHCNITPRATINGLCNIGQGCYIGSGSVLIQLVELADEIVLGAGAVVVKSLTESGTYVGTPARKIK
ncbi:acetyltransferase [Streptococcus hillyeri]|uniref:Acetyltransferase n=1 Tax=Streptococcus hillyeri TaxID=2282420 RepID=A0A3L9DM92_9STRE|nr:acetyltransferase [Streptococcus hillyeri]RLY02421.1 acetyltransferase [Streptococcus hillyeri]